MLTTTIIQPMPEELRLTITTYGAARLREPLVLKVGRGHPRGRTYAFLWCGRGVLWCGPPAEA